MQDWALLSPPKGCLVPPPAPHDWYDTLTIGEGGGTMSPWIICIFPQTSFAVGVLTCRLRFTGLIRTQKVVVAPWPQLWPQVWPHRFTEVIPTQKVVVAAWPQRWPQWSQVWPHGFT